MDDFAIRVSRVNKTFKLPHEKQSSIKGLVVNVFRSKRSFERQHVLKDINLEIKKGEFFGIVGKNGGGKSTLLKVLAGIYSPDTGSVEVNGKLTSFIELGVGFNPELTGRENVYLSGALLGFSEKEVTGMYDDIVSFAELERFMDQKLKNYSSGMQVRLAFSIAIRAKSDILVLDEVLAVGDAAFQQKCYDYFESLKKNKQTVVFVSHDMMAIQRFCTRVAYVRNGVIEEVGKTGRIAELYIRDNFSSPETDKSVEAKDLQMPVDIKLSMKSPANIRLGEEVKLSAKLHADAPYSVVIAASILHGEVYMGSFNTKNYTEELHLKAGENKFEIIIKTDSLNAGRYEIGCGVYEKESFRPLGLSDREIRFNVLSEAIHKDGISNIDGSIALIS